MIRLGLIGYPLSHSLSPELHNAFFDALDLEGEYRLYPVGPDDMDGLAEMARHVRSGKLRGLNVTIPHKQAVISLLDELTPSARAIGAVNTLYLRNNRLIGHNTDAPGFQTDLANLLSFELPQRNALILGAGGVARAVVYALLTDDWNVNLAVRRTDVGQAVALIKSFGSKAGNREMRSMLMEVESLGQLGNGIQLIVNATPIGMSPETEISPWPVGLSFPHEAAIYDVIYNPRQTRLVRDARSAGLRAMNGLGMLVEQAALSFACWTGRTVPREVIFAAVEA